MPMSSRGVTPVARAIRKNSHAASAEMIARSAESAAPPAKTMTAPMGIATTAKRTRRVSSDTAAPSEGAGSHLHDLGLFGLDHVVYLVNEVVVQLLKVLLRVLHVVLGHAVQLLERVAAVGARMPNGDLPLFSQLVDDLHELLAPLLVHRRQGNTDDLPLRGRLEPEIGLSDRLLDELDLTLVEWRDN